MVLAGIKYIFKMSQIITEEYPNASIVGFMKLDQTADFYFENTPSSFLDDSIHDAKNPKKRVLNLTRPVSFVDIIHHYFPENISEINMRDLASLKVLRPFSFK